jgi:hypothetical protein
MNFEHMNFDGWSIDWDSLFNAVYVLESKLDCIERAEARVIEGRMRACMAEYIAQGGPVVRGPIQQQIDEEDLADAVEEAFENVDLGVDE